MDELMNIFGTKVSKGESSGAPMPAEPIPAPRIPCVRLWNDAFNEVLLLKIARSEERRVGKECRL